MRQIESEVPHPRDDTDIHSGRTGSHDPIAALLAREQARHHSELVETRNQVARLLSAPPASLVASLDEELVALATMTVEAMSALHRHYRSGVDPPSTNIDEIFQAIGGHLHQVARLTRSALATHLTLEAQIRRSGQ